MAQIQKELASLADPKTAEHSQRFFKTGKGEYAEGDIFLGIRVPQLRALAKKYAQLELSEIKKLIRSKYHEERLTGLIILVNQYSQAKDQKEKQTLFDTYVKHFKYINNWDLVDVSCHKIIGPHLENTKRKPLYEWAKSQHLWTKRISIVSTYWYIRKGDLKDCFALSKVHLQDSHDLMHKAVGWMLRECGKQDRKRLEDFLLKHYQKMPRTMLRYAIEKLPERRRQQFLKRTA